MCRLGHKNQKLVKNRKSRNSYSWKVIHFTVFKISFHTLIHLLLLGIIIEYAADLLKEVVCRRNTFPTMKAALEDVQETMRIPQNVVDTYQRVDKMTVIENQLRRFNSSMKNSYFRAQPGP